jgi:hypothetical protein
MRTVQSVQISDSNQSDSNQDDGRLVRRRSSSFLSEPRLSGPAISEVATVVAILLIIIATAIPNLLRAGIADVESLALSPPAWSKFLRYF